MEYPELRVSFHLRDEHDERRYNVELNCVIPGEAAEDFSGPFPIEFDWDHPDSRAVALTRSDTSDRYGTWLSAAFFKDPGLREKFASARGKSAHHNALRVRLWLTPATPRLHGVLWERLQAPDTGTPLSTDEGVLISRFLSGGKPPPPKMRPRDRLRALVAIANPKGLDNQKERDLAPIAVEEELARAAASLKSIAIEKLVAPEPVSLENLTSKLRDGFDILYLVCHGALVNDEPLLWLENENGGIDRVSGEKLAARVRQLPDPPRLVVLASCQSGGRGEEAHSGDRGELAALAPKLAAAGVPAVIAMQGDVEMKTAGKFFPVFFEELLKDGQIDRAVAVARAEISDYPDWWVPVLITRLRFGRIWSEHGGEAGFSGVDAVAAIISTNDCTPILGPDLVTAWTGSPMELAQRWAQRFEFPMASRESDSLPQVAQYLAYHRNPRFVIEQLGEYVREFVVRKFSHQIGPGAARASTVVDLLNQSWRQGLQAAGEDAAKDPHWLLAQMPLPVYITTNRDDLLAEALRQVGKKPVVEVCRWRVFELQMSRPAGWPRSVFEDEPNYEPTVERPLVFHAFGHMRWPVTVVLTEDNFFDYLIGITKHEPQSRTKESGETGKAAIPQVVKDALSLRSLLFLGFRISDWEFRALFRRIEAQEGRGVRELKDIAVQLEPTASGEYLEPEGAREYLTGYFGNADVSIQWGSATAYIEALHAEWKARATR
jgi:hypothetical protein